MDKKIRLSAGSVPEKQVVCQMLGPTETKLNQSKNL